MKLRFSLSLILLCLSSCGSVPQTKTLDLDECIIDPDTGGQCSGPTFESQHTKSYKDMYGWVCRAPETDKAFWDACYLQRKVNGK